MQYPTLPVQQRESSATILHVCVVQGTYLNSGYHLVTPAIHNVYPLRKILRDYRFRIQFLVNKKTYNQHAAPSLKPPREQDDNQNRSNPVKPKTSEYLEARFGRPGSDAPHVAPFSIRANRDERAGNGRQTAHEFLHLRIHRTSRHFNSFGGHTHLHTIHPHLLNY